MKEINFDIVRLLKGHLLGELSREEEKQVEAWLQEDPERRFMLEELRGGQAWKQREEVFSRTHLQRAIRNFEKQVTHRKLHRWVLLGGKYAAVLIPLLVAVFILGPENPKPEEKPIMPGTSFAYLNIGGETFSLRAGENREFVLDSLATRLNTDAGILYTTSGSGREETVYARLTTPRGGEYIVVLPDSTKVYLNAESELRYPVAFNGDIREVFLTGEAFFEVKRRKQKPFVVSMADSRVEVLGTSFGVSSYPADQKTTTILESGVVRFWAKDSALVLAPGQLAEYNRKSELTTIKNVDPKYYTAWRHGQFYFDNTSLVEITTILGRWYDTEFRYTDEALKELKFSGVALRFKPLDFVLHLLEQTCSVKFVPVENKTIRIDYK